MYVIEKKYDNKIILIIYSVLTFFIPMYLWLENSSLDKIRNIPYFVGLILSFADIFICFRDKCGKKIISYALVYLILVVSILTFFVFFYRGENETQFLISSSVSYLISCSFCWLSFVIGKRIIFLIERKYFLITNIFVWIANCFFIISKVNLSLMQSDYGTNDPSFSGSYQYIGDIFSLISIILASQFVSNYKLKPFIPYFLSISLCIIFLNGSRASLLSMGAVYFWLLFYVFNLKPKIILKFLFAVSLSSLVASTALFFQDLKIEEYKKAILENRNFEMLLTGKSSSLEERNELEKAGTLNIFRSPFIGNYSEMNKFDKSDNGYIHNVLSLWEFFGIIPFALYLLATWQCLVIFCKSFRLLKSNEVIICGGILIFSLISVFCFRMPLAFFVVFIAFGICSTIATSIHYLSDLPFNQLRR